MLFTSSAHLAAESARWAGSDIANHLLSYTTAGEEVTIRYGRLRSIFDGQGRGGKKIRKSRKVACVRQMAAVASLAQRAAVRQCDGGLSLFWDLEKREDGEKEEGESSDGGVGETRFRKNPQQCARGWWLLSPLRVGGVDLAEFQLGRVQRSGPDAAAASTLQTTTLAWIFRSEHGMTRV